MAWSHRLTIIDRETTHRTKGCNYSSQFGHTMISHHSAHGEARDIDAILVYLIFLLHRLHDGFDKLDIARARDVPGIIFSLRINHQDLSRVCHLVPMGLPHLIIRILAESMQRDDHRSLLGQIGRHIHQHLSCSSTHLDGLFLWLLLIAMLRSSHYLQAEGTKQA